MVDFGVDVGLAFVWLGIDALGTFVPLPPCCYPPRPPVQGPFLALDALVEPAETAEPLMASSVEESTALAGTEDETQDEQVEGLSQDEDALEEDLLTTDETGAEDVATTEGTVDASEVTGKQREETDPEADDPTTTTGSSATVEAQGEVRGPDVGTSTDADADESADASPGDERNDDPAESEQTPSSNDDAATSAADSGTGDNDNEKGTE